MLKPSFKFEDGPKENKLYSFFNSELNKLGGNSFVEVGSFAANLNYPFSYY